MYSTLAFSITILGVFSILELLKANQRFSHLKYQMLFLLVWLTISSGLDYFDLIGYHIPFYLEVTKFIGTGLLINLFYVIVLKKIPRIVLFIEGILVFFFIIMFAFRLQFPELINNQLQIQQTTYHKVFYLFCFLFTMSSLIHVFIQLIKKSNKNLYEIKIKKWAGTLLISIFLLILIHVVFFVLFLKRVILFNNTSFFSIYIIRFYLILFILFRPKFLDDDRISIPFNEILVKPKMLSIQKFEFLFYTNHYYLLQDANIEDLAMKLNTSKNEVLNFLKKEIEENFTELLNKNRIDYFKELLKAKKYESFTIEALSEMSGFNNRRSMYNAFNKYVGMTPSEFIQVNK
jgi:AraC-like DNA-binding protein